MLPKENRLTGKVDYDNVQENGSVAQFPHYGIATFDRKDGNASRFGFIVSTKVAKKAVDRNNVKRILREAVRHLLVDVKPGIDIVFLAKQSIVTKPTSVLTKEVKESLKDLAILVR